MSAKVRMDRAGVVDSNVLLTLLRFFYRDRYFATHLRFVVEVSDVHL